MESFGERLAYARTRARLTQTSLAARSGTTKQRISNLERGRYSSPRLATVDRLAAVLGVDANWLHFGDGSPGCDDPSPRLPAGG